MAGLSHGEAVSLGLVAALRIGLRSGAHAPGAGRPCERGFEGLGLPTELGRGPGSRLLASC